MSHTDGVTWAIADWPMWPTIVQKRQKPHVEREILTNVTNNGNAYCPCMNKGKPYLEVEVIEVHVF